MSNRLMSFSAPAAAGARRLWRMTQLLGAGWQDCWAYARSSGLLRQWDQITSAGHVLKTAHRLDKGLALPHPRPGFGVQANALLREQLDRHRALHGADWVWTQGWATLRRHHLYGRGVPSQVLTEVQTRDTVQTAARRGFDELVRSRRSVRQFTGDPLPPDALRRAVDLARCSPSVCNRSGARVWTVTDADLRQRVLQEQNGHHGFADRAGAILIVGVDPSVFHTVGERHQAWIDGGLFAMTLILGLHHEGLGTCALNWSVTPAIDRRLKARVGLPRDEAIVMMLAVGVLPETFSVAHSPRRPLEEVMLTLNPEVRG